MTLTLNNLEVGGEVEAEVGVRSGLELRVGKWVEAGGGKRAELYLWSDFTICDIDTKNTVSQAAGPEPGTCLLVS